jgi:hypothetical protein
MVGSPHGVTTIGFNQSKTIMKRGIISFTSYSIVKWITFPYPINLSTTRKDLK